MSAATEETYLTPEQVAERLPGTTKWWVRRELNAGRLRGSKIGARWFVPASAVDEMVAAGSNQITARTNTARRRRRRST